MEFGLEEEGNAADGTYRQVATAIGHDITAEEVAEVIDNDVAYTGIAQMVVDERRKRGQPAVSHRLTVDAGNDVALCHLLFCEEGFSQTRRQPSLQQGVQETDAQHCSTTLVAKDVAQRRRVLNDVLTVVQTAVCTSAKDAGQTCLSSTDSNGSSQQVAMSLNMLSRGKSRKKQTTHKRLKFSTYAASIKVNIRRREGYFWQ